MDAPTPKEIGYFMPAEWEKHEATWLSWPKNRLTFPDSILPAVEEAYCGIVSGLQPGEKVKILVDSETEEQRVRKILHKNGVSEGNVLFHRIKSCDAWMRDYGPTFLLNRKGKARAAVRWIFNAWGEKYDDLLEDNKTGDVIAEAVAGSMPVFHPGIVMEGGSVDANGNGTLLTTEQCLLNKNRNPKLAKAQIEAYLRDYLGASNVIWLKEGIAGDDTDGHIDDFARFVSKNTVVCAREKDKGDENCAPLETAWKTLSSSIDQDGKPLNVVELPMPSPIIDPEENRRLPASYANFYIGNAAVLLPVFGDKNDDDAAGILQECFPGRKIVPIPSRELVYGYGGVHCITQQEPAL